MMSKRDTGTFNLYIREHTLVIVLTKTPFDVRDSTVSYVFILLEDESDVKSMSRVNSRV